MKQDVLIGPGNITRVADAKDEVSTRVCVCAQSCLFTTHLFIPIQLLNEGPVFKSHSRFLFVLLDVLYRLSNQMILLLQGLSGSSNQSAKLGLPKIQVSSHLQSS